MDLLTLHYKQAKSVVLTLVNPGNIISRNFPKPGLTNVILLNKYGNEERC